MYMYMCVPVHVHVAGNVDSVLIKGSVLVSGVVLYTSLYVLIKGVLAKI